MVSDVKVAKSLYSSIEDIHDLICNNQIHHDGYFMGSFVPMFSYVYKEEKKQLKKLRKALIVAHDWYSLKKYPQSDFK